MTIIVATNRMMVADSGEFQGGIVKCCLLPKIFRASNGGLYGLAGDVHWGQAFRKWIAGDRPKPEIKGDLSVLWMKPDGTVWRCDEALAFYPTAEPGLCGESAAEAFVTGALLAGASPERAVELACETCVWAKGPAQVERLEPAAGELIQVRYDQPGRMTGAPGPWLGT